MKVARIVFTAIAWLFVAGVVMQVFLVGMAVVARQMGWDNHISLGHLLAVPLVLMLVTAYLGKLPGRMKRLTWLLFAVYVLQADVLIFLRASAPALSALHPVLALVDFALGITLALRATALVRTNESPEVAQLQAERILAD